MITSILIVLLMRKSARISNLWPLRATNPKDLRPFARWDGGAPDWYARDQIYFVNLPVVIEIAHEAPLTVAAWERQEAQPGEDGQ